MASAEIPNVYLVRGNAINDAKDSAIGLFWGENNPNNTGIHLTYDVDIYRGEIAAAEYAIRKAIEKEYAEMNLYVISKILYICVTKFIPLWKSNEWKGPNGEKVKYLEEVMGLSDAIDTIKVNWILIDNELDNIGVQGAVVWICQALADDV